MEGGGDEIDMFQHDRQRAEHDHHNDEIRDQRGQLAFMVARKHQTVEINADGMKRMVR